MEKQNSEFMDRLSDVESRLNNSTQSPPPDLDHLSDRIALIESKVQNITQQLSHSVPPQTNEDLVKRISRIEAQLNNFTQSTQSP